MLPLERRMLRARGVGHEGEGLAFIRYILKDWRIQVLCPGSLSYLGFLSNLSHGMP